MKEKCILLAVFASILIAGLILYTRYENSKARARPWKECSSAFGQISIAMNMYKGDFSGQWPPTLSALESSQYLSAPYMKDYALLSADNGDYLLYRTSPLPELHRGDLIHIIGIDDVDEAKRKSPEVTPSTRPCLIVDSDGTNRVAKYIPEDEFKEFLEAWIGNHNKSGLEQSATRPPARERYLKDRAKEPNGHSE